MRGPFESLGLSYQNDRRSARETTSLLGMGLVVGISIFQLDLGLTEHLLR